MRESRKGLWLGAVSYNEALSVQESFYLENRSGWIGFETPCPTITVGNRANESDEILDAGRKGYFCVIKTDRGGLATVHSPGQLVIFPAMDISLSRIRPRELICELLKMVKTYSEKMISEPLEIKDQGLYSQVGKLGFIGLRIKNQRVFHGISLNISNDLNLFTAIKSCGVSGASHDSLAAYRPNLEPKQAFFELFDADQGLLSIKRRDITL